MIIEDRLTDRLGCFVPLNGPDYLLGVYKSAVYHRAATVMFYLGSPHRLNPPTGPQMRLTEYLARGYARRLPLDNMVIHAPYVINPASNKASVRANTLRALGEQIRLMEELGLSLLVLHPGSAVGQSREEGLEQLAQTVETLISQSSSVVIAIENMTAKGSLLCSRLEELQWLMKRINSQRVGICIDTCHLWDAGYNAEHVEEIVGQLSQLGLLDHLRIIHLNDSKHPKGSNRDIHDNIREDSNIGLAALKRWVDHPQFANIPIILETPINDDEPKGPYRQEIAALRGQ